MGYLIAVFDLSLLYMLLVYRDVYSMPRNSLLKHACYLVQQMRERVELYHGNTSYLQEKVMQSKILGSLIEKITDVD